MGVIKSKAKAGAQISLNTASGTGSYQVFSSTLGFPPAIVIFDNQSNVTVTISDDGTNDFMTFIAGEALVLDLRANGPPPANDLTWDANTQFFGKSASGSGSFRIAFIYAR